MLENYLKTSIRNLVRSKLYTLINIFSLSIGLVGCVLIGLYIKQQVSYDRFFKDNKRIYRVDVERRTATGTTYEAQTPRPVGPALKQEYSEVSAFTRLYIYGSALVYYGDKKFMQDGIAFADSTFFKVFSFKILRGNPDDLLSAPNSVVLTQGTARKYFGDENPVGKILKIDGNRSYTVTGVMQNIPANTHFHFDLVGAYSGMIPDPNMGTFEGQWNAYFGSYTYVLLSRYASASMLERKAGGLMMEHLKPPAGVRFALQFQPITSIHLDSEYMDSEEATNSYANLVALATIGLFILLLACFNFTNLSTARASKRAREVGVRKALGAQRHQLIYQFLGESILISLASLGVSLVLVELFMEPFSALLKTTLSFDLIESLPAASMIFVGTLLVGVLAGWYPAFYLSALEPGRVFHGGARSANPGSGRTFMRRALIVAQFAVSLCLMICTAVVFSQLNYMQNTPMGFNDNHVLTVPFGAQAMQDNYASVRNRFLAVPGVKEVSVESAAPVSENIFLTRMFPSDAERASGFVTNLKFVDCNYIKLYGLKLIAGRGFEQEMPTDSLDKLVVNEETVKRLGFPKPELAIGKKYDIGIGDLKATIIGVVRDFHIASLKSPIGPLVMAYNPRYFDEFSIKIAPAGIPATISGVRAAWEKISPDYPFRFDFVGEYVRTLYREERSISAVMTTSALLAVLVSSLGLVGLTAFVTELKKKEIGVRKVLGARISGIVYLLSNEFLRLVLVANIFAWPAAYYMINNWLDGFAYRVAVSPWVFLAVSSIAILIAVLTTSVQTIRAATANPVESLRYE